MLTLPANLPRVNDARLPATYTAAKAAIEKCVRVDECQDWANKAEAMASYARQAKDQELHKMADRIQARAIQRCGELLRQVEPSNGGRPSEKPGGLPPQVSRSRVAASAGLSTDQKKTALRVANIPKDEFEALVESPQPPTVSQLAERGKQSHAKPMFDLQGRKPEDFKASTRLQGSVKEFVKSIREIDMTAALRGVLPNELPGFTSNVHDARAALEKLAALLKKENQK